MALLYTLRELGRAHAVSLMNFVSAERIEQCVSSVKEISTMLARCRFMWFPCQPQLAITQLPHSPGIMTSGLCPTVFACVCVCVRGRACVCMCETCTPPCVLLLWNDWDTRDSDKWVCPSFIGSVLHQLNPSFQGLMVPFNLLLSHSSLPLSLCHPWGQPFFPFFLTPLLRLWRIFILRQESAFQVIFKLDLLLTIARCHGSSWIHFACLSPFNTIDSGIVLVFWLRICIGFAKVAIVCISFILFHRWGRGFALRVLI